MIIYDLNFMQNFKKIRFRIQYMWFLYFQKNQIEIEVLCKANGITCPHERIEEINNYSVKVLYCIFIFHTGPESRFLLNIYFSAVFKNYKNKNWMVVGMVLGGGLRGPRSSWRSNWSFKVCVNRKRVIEHSFLTKTVSLV